MNRAFTAASTLSMLVALADPALAARDLQPTGIGYFNTDSFDTAQDVTDQAQESTPYYLWVKVQWSEIYRRKSWNVAMFLDGQRVHDFTYDNVDSDGKVHSSASQRTLWKIPTYLGRGLRTLTVVVDDGNVVREGMLEYNNTLTREFRVTPFPSRLFFDDSRDFDGDGKTDFNLYDPLAAMWYTSADAAPPEMTQFGFEPTIQFTGDFDGDGLSDKGVFDRTEGMWYIQQTTGGLYIAQFGFSTCVPAPADYDGDGRSDLAVYDTVGAVYYIHLASGTVSQVPLGVKGSTPYPRDYDGDGRSDPAVYDPGSSDWYIQQSTAGMVTRPWGKEGDTPVPFDIDGDGMCDLITYDPSGSWSVFSTVNGTYQVDFGFGGAVPSPGDYDGDGVDEFAVYDPPTGTWYVLTTNATVRQLQFGWSGALPVGIRD